MKSRVVVVGGLAAAAAVLVGVLIVISRDEPTSTTAAATVNGVDISQHDVIAELDAVAGNDAYVSASSLRIRGDEAGTYDPAFVADVLQRWVVNELIRAEVQQLGLHADDECRIAARTGVVTDLGRGSEAKGQPIFDAFPAEYQDTLVRWSLDELLLTAHLAGQACVSSDAAKAYYDAHLSEFEEACLSIIQVATEADAVAMLADLRGGADFATLARARSTEPVSAPGGGSLGCKPKNQIPTDFLPAAFETPVGSVSEPVTTSGGFTLVRVDDRRQLPLDAVREQVSELAAVAATNAFDQWLNQAVRSATIQINPTYGTWNEQRLAIDPPGTASSSSGPPVSIAAGSSDAVAATVGTTTITEADLNAELNAIGANVAYVDDTHAALVTRGSGVRSADGTFDPGFVRTTLGRRITLAMVHDEVVRRGLDATPCRPLADERLPAQLAGGDTEKGQAYLAGFDAAYRDQLVAWNADVLALQAALLGVGCERPPSQQQAGAAYASWLDDTLAAVRVTVAPQYGTWVQSSGTIAP